MGNTICTSPISTLSANFCHFPALVGPALRISTFGQFLPNYFILSTLAGAKERAASIQPPPNIWRWYIWSQKISLGLYLKSGEYVADLKKKMLPFLYGPKKLISYHSSCLKKKGKQVLLNIFILSLIKVAEQVFVYFV